MIDTEDPHGIILDYQDPASGLTLAQSKWFFANAEFEFKKCEVLRYLSQEELYEVRWLCNNSVKKVSRFNLLFDREDPKVFEKRIEEAKVYREDAELIMKYYYMI